MKTIKQTLALATLGGCISLAAVAWGTEQPSAGKPELKPVRSGKQAAVDLVEVPLPAANPSYAWYNPPGKPAAAVPAPMQAAARLPPAVPAAAPVAVPVAPHPALLSAAPTVQNVDFHREADGGGRVVITLPNDTTPVKDDKQGNIITLTLNDVDVPQNLRKRMDVMDFGTPVSEVEIAQRGGDARIRITAHEGFEYHTQRTGGEYLVYVDKLKVKPDAQLTGEKKKLDFKGDKLSLNFQDIEVRSVLQLLADFTNKNIVVNDAVQGNITVRLKDVPWDQALDIVLKSKHLGMKEEGNVIWVAPAAEMEAQTTQELKELQDRQQLEPVVSEAIPINFAEAEQIATLLQSSRSSDSKESVSRNGSGANTNKDAESASATTSKQIQTVTNLLSDRGQVSFDKRTNTLLVQDVASNIKGIREMVKLLDVPVQQVLIESRIVTANDAFSKDLGSRFGVTHKSVDRTGFSTPSQPSVNGFSVNLPAAGAAGSLGFSLLSKDFMMDLELSALQSESKGEIISSPRVITSDNVVATIKQGVQIPYQVAGTNNSPSTVAFKDAVLKLEVTPHITTDEHVSMKLKVNQDTVGDVYSGVPSINTREVQTDVLVENGQTVVLGGVHEEENIKSATKVPVLGDLPVIGNAFRSTGKSNKNRELLIFVTPKIVDPNNH